MQKIAKGCKRFVLNSLNSVNESISGGEKAVFAIKSRKMKQGVVLN